MLKRIKELKTSRPEIISYRYLDNFFQAVNSRSFFRSDPLQRIHRLFQSYLTYKNLSAKMAKELETGIYDENCNSIPISSFRRTLLDAENNAIHISLYVEHLARLTILKKGSCSLHRPRPCAAQGRCRASNFPRCAGRPSTYRLCARELPT